MKQQAHVWSLRWGCIGLLLISVLLAIGWWNAPRDLTIHIPPDLRSGSVRKLWEVPPSTVYSFTFYIFQQLNRWPNNGDDDYPRNIRMLSSYLTPACQLFLREDANRRRDSAELRQRVRGVYEIPGRGYGDNPTSRVQVMSDDDWIVTLDLTVDEYYNAEQVKRALVRYALKVVRWDIDPERNPFGLALDCYKQPPQRIGRPPADETEESSS